MMEIIKDIPQIISSIAALLTVLISYKAIKVNKEIFNQTQKSEEQKLLPLFELYRDYIFLKKGLPVKENPDPHNITSLYFMNKNPSPITNIIALASDKKDDTKPLITAKIFRQYIIQPTE